MIDARASAAGRIGFLESIRGLAAMQVLLLHALSAFFPNAVFALPGNGTIGGYIHLSPLYFLYDGCSAVYIFLALSGFVLTRSFANRLDRPLRVAMARAVRLGIPAVIAVGISALTLFVFGRLNADVGAATQSDWFAAQWNPELSLAAVVKDAIINALFLGYQGISSTYPVLAAFQQPSETSFLVPLWTLSMEFYGSLLVLALCLCARNARPVWMIAASLAAVYFLRSAYICFIAGHVAAVVIDKVAFQRPGKMLSVCAIGLGILLCILADLWQPAWLKGLYSWQTPWLFPGQYPALQQKAAGALLVLAGIVALPGLRQALSNKKLVSLSKLSFPLYLIHWPILFGPSAALFLLLVGWVGSETAAAISVIATVALSLAASVLFMPIDRFALDLSRRLSGPSRVGASRTRPAIAARAEVAV